MLTPGRNRIGTTLRLKSTYKNTSEVLVDPTTLIAKLYDPNARAYSYTYGTDTELGKTSTGKYYLDTTPNEAGRWYVRWEATFSDGSQLAIEDNYIVEWSPFFDRTQPSSDNLISSETSGYLSLE